MDAVSIIARVDNDWRYVTIATVEYPATVGIMLKENYLSLDKVVELFDQGNIVTLGATVAETVFAGTPSGTIAEVKNQSNDFDIADYNFIMAMDRVGNRSWVMTRFGIDGYYNI